ncbi:MAG TPA: D-alanyl-D-alanine carboxypeptidase [Candidatus Uhrbacteria bacterium]|nr:D-alanyl-D-alanine carboxypeptidase [Candidatus Uhrbacteria bacterium]
MLLEILFTLIFLPNFLQQHVNAEDFSIAGNKEQMGNLEKAPEKIHSDVLDIQISAKSALAVDSQSGKILYQKNAEETRSIASITKLMTALVFLDHNPGWQKEFFTIVSDRRNGGIIHLNIGEILTIRNLFYTALIASDNDAAIALARSTGLSEEDFIREMNAKAVFLGLNNTNFADPSGLNNNNRSNARETVKLLNFALANEEIEKAVNINNYEFEVQNKEKERLVRLKNTNWLLNSYLDVAGGKTGALAESGYNLAVKIKGKNNQEILITVLGSQSNFDRFQDVKAIADFVFVNYQWLAE